MENDINKQIIGQIIKVTQAIEGYKEADKEVAQNANRYLL